METSADSLQTNSPLAELRAEHTARPLGWFEQLLCSEDDTELDIDQPYQRGHVWGDHRRRLLIKSFMQGIPVGAIVVNDRLAAHFQHDEYGTDQRIPSRNWATAIIDGKQRCMTFVMWLRSELTVPASWFPESEIVETEDTADGGGSTGRE